MPKVLSKDMDHVDVRLKSPFTAVVAGPTGSGKTQMILDLVNKASDVSFPPPHEIIYCYGEWQSAFEKAPKSIIFHHGLIDIKSDIPSDGHNRWLILDDLMEEISGKSDTNALFTKMSHHRNISVFFLIQYLFKKENRIDEINSKLMSFQFF